MSVFAWHFVDATLRDGSPLPADGVPLIHTGLLAICASGLHASERIIDGLQYAPGNTICRVECSGEIVRQNDKLVCCERTILWRIDGTDLLRLFARQCALDVAHLWDMPAVVRLYLETGDEKIRVAAMSAARVAAMSAAWDAAGAAARVAAMSAAWAASRDAAGAAARDAAWAASRDAAWAASRDGARDAAGAAARDAVWAAQNTRLESMVIAAHGT